MAQSLESKATLGPNTFVNLFPEPERTDASGPQLVSVDNIAEIQIERLLNTREAQDLRQSWLYPGDTGNYGLEANGDVSVIIANFANHPAPIKEGRKDFGAFANELTRNDDYFFDGKDLEAKALLGEGVTKVNLSLLQRAGLLLGGGPKWRWVTVSLSTEQLSKGKEAVRECYKSRVYDQNVDSGKVANELVKLIDTTHGSAIYGDNGIAAKLSADLETNTNIRMLDVGYVKEMLEDKAKGTKLALASRLDDFKDRSNASLDVRDLYDPRFVRGVVWEGKNR